jgi:hypothetical protein
MAEDNTATPLPAPDSGGTTPTPQPAQPNLSVVPPDDPQSASRQSGLTKRQMEGVTLTLDVITEARKPIYFPALEAEGITAAYLDSLAESCKQLVRHGQNSIACDSDSKDADQQGETAEETLLQTLQSIQAAARVKHLPDHPAMLDKYHVGEKLDQSRSILETRSQQLIEQADTDRPGSINTDFIAKANEQREKVVNWERSQDDCSGDAKQQRQLRDKLFTGRISISCRAV